MNSMYSEVILDYYRNPPNKGQIANADSEAHEANTTCGDKLTVSLKIANGKVTQAKFDGTGCIISQASVSMLCEYIEGKTLKEIEKMKDEEALKLIGIKLTPMRLLCALLGLKAVKKALVKK